MEIQYSLPNLTNTLQIIGCHMGSFPAQWSYPWHHHFLFELLYCKEGEVRQTVGEHAFSLCAGDWLLIKSGISHATENRSELPYTFFNLHFDLDDPVIRAKLCESDFLVIKAGDAEERSLSMHFEAMERAVLQNYHSDNQDTEKAIQRLIIQSHTLGIITSFLQLSGKNRQMWQESDEHSYNCTAFETELAHAIEAKLRSDDSGSIADIAASLGISRGRCTHLFTKVYGQSPRQYKSRLILNQAKHLLVQSTCTMEELAEKLGFQSASHFSRQFRRWTGMPPSAFRPKYVRSEGSDSNGKSLPPR